MPPKPRPGRELVPGHGLLFPGHATDPASVEAEVDAYLADTPDPWKRREARQKLRNSRISRAYWAGPEIGFCGPDHPNAEPVTIVALDL